MTATDDWITFADSHMLPNESIEACEGWPKGSMGPAKIEKLKAMGIENTSQLLGFALSLTYDEFVAKFGGKDGALDNRAAGFYAFFHRAFLSNTRQLGRPLRDH